MNGQAECLVQVTNLDRNGALHFPFFTVGREEGIDVCSGFCTQASVGIAIVWREST